jgi:hypothetical protein
MSWLNPGNASRCFRDETSDGGQAIDSTSRKGLEISLNAGAGAAIASRDAERDRNGMTI